ncbi:MAG: hypothetical protein Tsb0015_16050 [Simkaniaceae bacterium]
MQSVIADSQISFIQKIFFPQDASWVIRALSKAADYVEQGDFFSAHFAAPGCTLAASLFSAGNTLAYPIRGTSSFVTHLINLEGERAIASLGNDLYASMQSLFFAAVGVVLAVSSFFYPNLLISFRPQRTEEISENLPGYGSQVSDLHQQLQQAAEEAQNYRQRVQQLQQQLQQRNEDASAANEQISSLANQLEQSRAERQQTEEQLGEEIDRQREEVSRAENQLLLEQNRVQELQQDLSHARNRSNELLENAENVQKTMQRLQEQLNQALEEKAALEKVQQQQSEELSLKSSEYSKLQEKLDQLQLQYEKLCLKHSNLEQQLNAAQPEKSQYKKLETEIAVLKEQLEQVLQEKRELQTTKEKTEETVEGLKEKLSTAEESQRRLQEKMETSHSEHELKKKQELQSLQQEKSKLEGEITTLKEQLEQVLQEKRELQTTKEKTEETVEGLKEKLSAAEESQRRLQEKMESAFLERSQEKEQELQNLQQEKSKLENEINSLRKKLSQALQGKEDILRTKEKAKQAASVLLEEKKQQEEKLQVMSNELQKFKQVAKEAVELLEESKTNKALNGKQQVGRLEQNIQVLQGKLKDAEKTCLFFAQNHERLSSELKEQIRDNTFLQREISTLKERCRQLESKSIAERMALHKEIEKSEQNYNDLSKSFIILEKKLKEEIHQLKEKQLRVSQIANIFSELTKLKEAASSEDRTVIQQVENSLINLQQHLSSSEAPRTLIYEFVIGEGKQEIRVETQKLSSIDEFLGFFRKKILPHISEKISMESSEELLNASSLNTSSLSDSLYSSFIVTEEPANDWKVDKIWELFSYEEVAKQKYRTVLMQYKSGLESKFDMGQVKALVFRLQRENSNNVFYDNIQKFLYSLYYEEDPRKGYQEGILFLRKALESVEYKNIQRKKVDALAIEEKQIRDFIREFCLLRWSGTHLYNYLTDIVHLTTGENVPKEIALEDFPKLILDTNEKISKSSKNKKSRLALELQKFYGAIGKEDFCGSKNTPNVRNTQSFRDANGKIQNITFARHGSPTAFGSDYSKTSLLVRGLIAPLTRVMDQYMPNYALDLENGEEVTSDYIEYLWALAEKGESELFCVFQRRTPNIFESERTRAMKIDRLQNDFKNIHVLTQPVEGELFERKGAYNQDVTFEDLKRDLEKEFFDLNPSAITTRSCLPKYFQESKRKKEYQETFRQLMNDVQEIFFPNKKFVIDPKTKGSINALTRQLDDLYSRRNGKIKIALNTLHLNDLIAGGEKASIDEETLAGYLNDHEIYDILQRLIRTQITDKETLGSWIPKEKYARELEEKSFPELMANQEITKYVAKNILIAMKQQQEDISLLETEIAELEDKKSQFLADWQSFILLVYVFQRNDMKARLDGANGFKLTKFKTPCKDFLDRGGNQGFIEDRLFHYALGIEKDRERMLETFHNLLGPPILVKKKEVITKRILPGLQVENLLREMTPEQRKKLSGYKFAGKWSISGLDVPKKPGQTGHPSVQELLVRKFGETLKLPEDAMQELDKKALEENIEPMLAEFKKYEGLAVQEWKKISLEETEKGYRKDRTGAFLSESIKKQVNREIENSKLSSKYELIQQDGTRRNIENFDDLLKSLSEHPLIEKESMALQILSTFHQGIGGEIQLDLIQNFLGRSAEQAFMLRNKSPKETCKGEILRMLTLDLSAKDKITYRYSDQYALSKKPDFFDSMNQERQADSSSLMDLKGEAMVVYEKGGQEDELAEEPYINWYVHKVHETN